MASQRRNTLKPVALLLVFAVLQFCVLITPAKASAATNTTSTNTAPSSVRFGQLLMSENQSALVNGTSATTGTTIFSGTQLQTPDGVGATVSLGALGRISIDPNTLLTLTFDKENVDVKVSAGNAVLTTNTGVEGTLTTAEGMKLKTNSNSANPTAGGKARRLSKRAAGAIIFAGVVAVALIVVVALDDDDDSPSGN
jgi:hypothetical protein